LYKNEVLFLPADAIHQWIECSDTDGIGIQVQERVERTREAPKFPILMSYLRPKGAGWRRYDGYIEWMMVAIEAFSRDHDRYAGADVLNTPDEEDGQMEVAGIGEDVDPEVCSFAKPRHPHPRRAMPVSRPRSWRS
jgi:hypothetical protein